MLAAVEDLRKATIALGSIPHDDISRHILSINREHQARILRILTLDEHFFFTKDGTLTALDYDRLEFAGISKLVQQYASIDRVFLTVAEAMFKGIPQVQLTQLVPLDQKYISRFITILRDAGAVIYSPKRVLFASFLVGNENPKLLELFNYNYATENTIDDFNLYLREIKQIKQLILDYFYKDNGYKLGAELIRYVDLKLPNMQFRQDSTRVLSVMEDAEMLKRIVVYKQHFFILGTQQPGLLNSSYKPLDYLHKLPYVSNGHFTDGIFAASIGTGNQLSQLLQQYLSHDYFKVSRQMSKILLGIYPFGIDKYYNIFFYGFSAIPEKLHLLREYGELIAQKASIQEYDQEDVDEQAHGQGTQKEEKYNVIMQKFYAKNVTVSMQRIIRCYNVYSIVESLDVIAESQLYHLHYVYITNSGSFVVLCIKQHATIVSDLLDIGLIKKYTYKEQDFYTAENVITEQYLEQAYYAAKQMQAAEDSEPQYYECVNVGYYVKDNAKRLALFIYTVYDIISTSPQISKLFKPMMFSAEHLVQHFTIRQIMQQINAYQQLYDQQLKQIVEYRLMDVKLLDLPDKVAYYFFGSCESFNMIVYRFNSTMRYLGKINVVKQVRVDQAVHPEVFMNLNDRQRKKPAFALCEDYVFNVEHFAPLLFRGDEVHALVNGLTYLRTNILTYFAEIYLKTYGNYMRILRVLRDFIDRLKTIDKEVNLQEIAYFDRGRELDYCNDYAIDAYDAIVKARLDLLPQSASRATFSDADMRLFKKYVYQGVVLVEDLYTLKHFDVPLEHFAAQFVSTLSRLESWYPVAVLFDGQRIYPFKLSLAESSKKQARSYESRVKLQSADAQDGMDVQQEQPPTSAAMGKSKQELRKIMCRRPKQYCSRFYYHVTGSSYQIYADYCRQMSKQFSNSKNGTASSEHGIRIKQNQCCYYADGCQVVPFRPLFSLQEDYADGDLATFATVCYYYENKVPLQDSTAYEYALMFDLMEDNKITHLYREIDDIWMDMDKAMNDSQKMEYSTIEMKSLVHQLIVGRISYANGAFAKNEDPPIEIHYGKPVPFRDIPLPEPNYVSPDNSFFSLLEDTNKAQASEYDGMFESSQREVSESLERRSKMNLADFLKANAVSKKPTQELSDSDKQNASQFITQAHDNQQIRQLYPDVQVLKATQNERMAFMVSYLGNRDSAAYFALVKELTRLSSSYKLDGVELPTYLQHGWFFYNWGWSEMTYGSKNDNQEIPNSVVDDLKRNIIRYLRIRNCTAVGELMQFFNYVPPSLISKCINQLVGQQMIILRALGKYVCQQLNGKPQERQYLVEYCE